MTLADDLTEEELAELAENGTDEEKRVVAKHPNTGLHTLSYLAENGFAEDVDQNPMMLLHIEGGSDTVVSILMKIAEQTQRGERLEELASSIWNDVRSCVADNKSTSTATLFLLAKDEDWSVRRGVAWNSSTPPDTLSFLDKDKEAYVRRGVASNANTPPTTLSLLAKDKNEYVRHSVAINVNTPPATLSILAKDKEEYVRTGVASNENTTPTTLSILAKDKSREVSRSARSTLAKLKKDRP